MLIFSLSGCGAEPRPCDAGTRAVALDETLSVSEDDGAENTGDPFTAEELLAPLEAPQTVEAVDGTGVAAAVTVVATSTGEDAELRGDTSPGCQGWLMIPIVATLTSEDGRFSLAGDGDLVLDLQAGTYWRTFELPLDGDDQLPDGTHGPVVSGNWATVWGDGALSRISVDALTEGGAQELLLWFRY